MFFQSLLTIAALGIFLFPYVVDGAEPSPNFDGLVTTPERDQLLGQDAVIQFRNGIRVSETSITDFVTDRRSGAIRFVQYIDGRRKTRKPISDIYRMRIGTSLYGFRYHYPSKGVFLTNSSAAMREAERRLKNENRTFRLPQTEEEVKGTTEKIRLPFDFAVKKMPDANLTIFETPQILLLTDFPPPAASTLASSLDNMCEAMNDLFGLPTTANCWNGKALVAAFSNRNSLVEFEHEIMNNKNIGSRTMLYHANSERFMAVCHRPVFGPKLAEALCWSLSGGYVRRYQSNVPLPKWLYIGTHGWVTQELFPDRKKQAADIKRFRKELLEQGSLLGLLEQTDIRNKRYVLCILLTQFLIETDRTSFGQLLEDIKLGWDWEKSLYSNYGVTENQFVEHFGQQLGVANLQP